MAPAVPYWRLSAFYFFYFAVLGSLLPYWGLYLQSLGFNAKVIGLLSAIVMATKIIAPNIWGIIADRRGRRIGIIRFGSLVACIAFAAILFKQSVLWFVLVISVYSFFWNAVLAQFEVVTLGHLIERPYNYSRIRLWGSIGFIAAVVGLGYFFEQASLDYLPWIITFILALIWFSSLWITEKPLHQNGEEGSNFWQQLKRPKVMSFFIACFLLQVSHGPYYVFYSIYLEDYGMASTTIGWLWALGVIAEVIMFLLMHRLFAKNQYTGGVVSESGLIICALVIDWFFPRAVERFIVCPVITCF